MKRILIILLVVVLGQTSKAQAPVFDTCQNLAQYNGEWRHISGTDTLRVFLRDHRSSSLEENGGYFIINRLWGWVDYKTGSATIESNYQHRFSILPYNYDTIDTLNFSISLYMPECNDSWLKLKGSMWDSQTQKKYFDVDISINSVKTTMTWKLRYPEGYMLIAGTGYNYFLPKEFVLVKQ